MALKGRLVGLVCEKLGRPCFWTNQKGQCTYNQSGCETISDECKECDLKVELKSKVYCSVYACPKAQWLYKRHCPLATHIKKAAEEKAKMVNPLKASKRGGKKKR